MIFPLPTAEEKAALLSRHAARFPEAFTCKVPGDAGAEEELRIVLGVPAADAPGWANSIAASLKPRSVDVDEDALVADCLLWPAARDWAKLLERWPALAGRAARACRLKLGSSLDMIDEPKKGDKPPEFVVAAQAANPAVVWRILTPSKGVRVDVAIAPPTEIVWRSFRDAIQPADAPCWKLALDVANDALVASSTTAVDLFARYPGAALLVTLTASHLAGVNAEFHRGEF